MKEEELKEGMEVYWTYDHSLGRCYTQITKKGKFIRLIRYGGFCWVHFDGNKRMSRVAVKDLWEKKQKILGI